MCLIKPRRKSVVVLSLLVGFCFTTATVYGQNKPTSKRVKEIERKIDAMASRNKASEMVHGIRDYEHGAPLVSRDYDWAEQDRVQKAIEAVQSDLTEEMANQLLKHENDTRYAFTMVFDDVVNVKNVTVGEICEDIGPDFTAVCTRHIPKASGDMYFVLSIKHDKRPLYIRQIELCEEAIKKVNIVLGTTEAIHGNDYRSEQKAHVFTLEEKAQFVKDLKKQIEELKRTKKAIIEKGKMQNIYVSAWDPLTPDAAKEVREEYDKNNKKSTAKNQ
jgi:hypothetical protein